MKIWTLCVLSTTLIPVCSLRSRNFEHCDAFAVSVDFVGVDMPYNDSRARQRNLNDAALLLQTWNPCGSFAVRMHPLRSTCTSSAVCCSFDCGRWCPKGIWRCTKRLVRLVLSKHRWKRGKRHRNLDPYRLPSTTNLLFVLTVVLCSLHSIAY